MMMGSQYPDGHPPYPNAESQRLVCSAQVGNMLGGRPSAADSLESARNRAESARIRADSRESAAEGLPPSILPTGWHANQMWGQPCHI